MKHSHHTHGFKTDNTKNFVSNISKRCYICSNATIKWRLIYYWLFISIFQILKLILVNGWRENFNLFKNVILDPRWREFYIISAISRLVLCQLRDEIIENNSETKKDHIVSNKSLIIYSILNFSSLFISSDVSMIFMSTTLGWELAGIFYKAIQKYYPV